MTLAFKDFEERFLATVGNPEHLLEKGIVRNLKDEATLVAQNREHQIAVDHAAFQVFGQNLHGLPQMEWPPDSYEKTGGHVADDGPYGEETNS